MYAAFSKKERAPLAISKETLNPAKLFLILENTLMPYVKNSMGSMCNLQQDKAQYTTAGKPRIFYSFGDSRLWINQLKAPTKILWKTFEGP